MFSQHSLSKGFKMVKNKSLKINLSKNKYKFNADSEGSLISYTVEEYDADDVMKESVWDGHIFKI